MFMLWMIIYLCCIEVLTSHSCQSSSNLRWMDAPLLGDLRWWRGYLFFLRKRGRIKMVSYWGLHIWGFMIRWNTNRREGRIVTNGVRRILESSQCLDGTEWNGMKLLLFWNKYGWKDGMIFVSGTVGGGCSYLARLAEGKDRGLLWSLWIGDRWRNGAGNAF